MGGLSSRYTDCLSATVDGHPAGKIDRTKKVIKEKMCEGSPIGSPDALFSAVHK